MQAQLISFSLGLLDQKTLQNDDTTKEEKKLNGSAQYSQTPNLVKFNCNELLNCKKNWGNKLTFVFVSHLIMGAGTLQAKKLKLFWDYNLIYRIGMQ